MPKVDTKRFYLKSLNLHGYTPKGLHWSSVDTQKIRFGVIYDMLCKELPKSTIIDAGCGFGDLYLYLMDKNTLPRKYIGYDMLEHCVSYASLQTAQDIYQKDILVDTLHKADFYVASGSLNILHPYESAVFLQRMFEHSTQGIVFNFLHSDKQSDVFNYIEPDFVQELFSKHEIVFRDGYLQDDVTAFVRR